MASLTNGRNDTFNFDISFIAAGEVFLGGGSSNVNEFDVFGGHDFMGYSIESMGLRFDSLDIVLAPGDNHVNLDARFYVNGSPVPLPATALLLASACTGLGAGLRRRTAG